MPEHTADFAQYVRIITWFLDTPSPLAPFSVHRMALAGKELGKDVGQWFGPSTAAGAIRTLVGMFPSAGLGVAVAVDGVVYQTDVYSASHGPIGSPRRHRTTNWGDRGVLVLIGVRLGLDGVNPIYYDTIKASFFTPTCNKFSITSL
jgi:cysteine protease ATG4